MKKPKLQNSYTHPVVIGGVGGSGTRLIAQCLRELGYFIGHDLNEPCDNLWFTLLFTRVEILKSSNKEFNELVEIMLKGMMGRNDFTQKQIKLINELASKDRLQLPTARQSLKYWCIVHRRVIDTGKLMRKNFLLLDYDKFCLNPEDGITELSEFLELDSSKVPKEYLTTMVKPPDSIGRFKLYGTKIFDMKDVEYVKDLGFNVSEN